MRGHATKRGGTVAEPGRRVRVMGEFDVVVAGGGPAGIAAAVAAGRQRARVLLIEQMGCLGGMSTSGLVPVFAPFGRTRERLIRGIFQEVVDRLGAAAAKVHQDRSGFGWIPIEAEPLKKVYDDMVEEAGVTVRYFTVLADCLKRRRTVTAVLLQSKAGREAALGRVFVDATGDGDLAMRAGAEMEKGDGRGRMQPAGLCIVVAGVDIRQYHRHLDGRGIHQVLDWLAGLQREGLLPRVKKAEYRGVHGQEVGPGILAFNFGHVFDVDGTRPEDQARVMVTGRRMANGFVQYARGHLPGMKDAQLVATASLPGIRESRRIRGRATLRVEDCLRGRHFEDEIARYDYPVDVHNVSADRRQRERFVKEFDTLVLPAGASYGIPFGAMVPVGLDNVLVAGRALSCDRYAHGSVRTMPACFAMGQAAGIAAAMAVRRSVRVGDVDVRELQGALERAGAVV